MYRILCYGDSNTWGYISGSDHLRYDENTRWTRLLQKNLGKDYEIIEEGLSSRTLKSEDLRVGKEGKNGFLYLKPCIETHDKFDAVVLMLGTNELKMQYNNSSQDIFNMYLDFIRFITGYKSQIDKSSPLLIVSGIPPVVENDESCLDNKFLGAEQKGKEFSNILKEHCEKNNVYYLDNQDLSVGVDGVHLTKESHSLLANKLAKLIKNI